VLVTEYYCCTGNKPSNIRLSDCYASAQCSCNVTTWRLRRRWYRLLTDTWLNSCCLSIIILQLTHASCTLVTGGISFITAQLCHRETVYVLLVPTSYTARHIWIRRKIRFVTARTSFHHFVVYICQCLYNLSLHWLYHLRSSFFPIYKMPHNE